MLKTGKWVVPLVCAAFLWGGCDPGSRLLGQRLPEYFRSYQAFKEANNLVRAVHKNRLTVLIEEQPSGELALVATHFKVGRLDDARGLARIVGGLAEQSLAESLESLGAMVTLEVGDHLTSVVSVISAQDLGEALRAHAALFSLSEKGWEFEEERVSDARQEERSLPAYERRHALFELVRSATATTPDDVTGEVVRDFIRNQLRPENSILTVVGTVRREVVLPRVARELEDLKVPPVEPIEIKTKATEPKPEFQYREVRAAVAAPSVLVGFPVPGDADLEEPVLTLVRYMMTEGYASLISIPREGDKGRALLARSGTGTNREGALLWFEIDTGKASLESAETRFFVVLRALADEDPPEAIVNRGKALMLTDWYASQETLEGRSAALARSEVKGDFTSRDRFPDRLKAITGRQVREAVRRYLTVDSASVLEYLPNEFESRTFTASGFLETLKTLVAAQLPEEKAFLVSLGADGEVGQFQVPALPASYGEEPLRKSSVLRGPMILLRERHFLPLVHFGFFYVGGRVSETPENAGLTEVLTRSVLEYRMRTAPLEMLALEASGARFEPIDEEEFFGIRLTVTSNTLDRVFGHIVNWLREAAEFSESDIDCARRSFAIDLDEHCGDSCRNRMEALQEIFADQLYGFTALALSRPLQAFRPEQLAEWRDRFTVKTLPVFVVSGDVSGTSFLEGLVSRLSDPSFSQGKLPSLKARYADKEPVTRRWRDRTLLLFEGPKAGSDYVEMLDLASHLMSGRSGRVEEKLRAENLGFHFDIRQKSLSGGGVVEIDVISASDHQDEAVKAALAAIRDTRESTVPPAQFRGAQVKTILRLLARQQDPETFLSDTMRAVLAGEPADYATRYRLNIRQMRMGEVEMAIDRYLAEDQ